VLWLLACYSPPAYVFPAPAEVTMADVLDAAPGTRAGDPPAGEGDPPGGEGHQGEDGAGTIADPGVEVEAETEGATEAARASSPGGEGVGADDDFDDTEVRPYKAFTVKTPLSIVDDAGQPVTVLAKPGVAVTVLAEGSLRVKVRCDGCDPVVEGYLQASAVQR
jgi:hypothetical protein